MKPFGVMGKKLEAGHYIMGMVDDKERTKIHIESCGREIDKRLNTKMFE